MVGSILSVEQTKHFICECTRCIACTTDPDSGTSIVDRGISGVLCQRCVEQVSTQAAIHE